MNRIQFVITLFSLSFLCSCASSKLTVEEQKAKNYQPVYGLIDISENEVRPDALPKYPNGNTGLIKDIQKYVEYPTSAKEKGIEGNVIISFMVDNKGNVKHVKVERSVHPDLDQAAKEVLKKVRQFVPAIIDGKDAEIKLKTLVTFRKPLDLDQYME